MNEIQELREEKKRLHEFIFIIFILSLLGNLLASCLYNYVPTNKIKSLTFSLIIIIIFIISWAIKKIILQEQLKSTPIPVVFIYSKQSRFYYSLFSGYKAYSDFGGACEKLFKQNQEYRETLQSWDITNPIFSDLLEFVILRWLNKNYSHIWLFDKPVRHIQLTSYPHKKRPTTIIIFKDIPKSIRENNIFFTTLSKDNKNKYIFDSFNIAVPKDVKFYTEPRNIKTGETINIILENKYCKIKISGAVRGGGLGEEHYSILGALFQPWARVTPYKKTIEQEFTSRRYEIKITASFSSLWRIVSYFFSWLPYVDNIEDYYDWSQFLSEDLKYDFDWDFYIRNENWEIIRIQAELFEIKKLIQKSNNDIHTL